MFGLFSSQHKNNAIGLEFLPTGIAIVESVNSGKKAGLIKRHQFIESVGQQAQTEALSTWVKENNAAKIKCHCLVASGDYNMYQIEAPQVDESEIEDAIKWKVKDLVTYDVDSAVIDYFPMPDSPKNQSKQITVIAANESTISAYVDIVKNAGLAMQVIDISELVLKNIFNLVECETNTIAVLTMNEQVGQLYIFKEGKLYVVRDFKVGLKQLAEQETQEASFDSVLLEIQRSVDYFESYYGLGSISKLLISPQIEASENMANYLQNYVNFEIDFLSVGFISEHNASLEFDHRCFMSYCSSLRST